MNIIRTATALTRYPIHRLTKQGQIAIEFKATDEEGQFTLQWEVSHNSKYGQPGPLAYKLDTLIINRRIEQAGYPVPIALKLGSFREICRELGVSDDSGKNVAAVRKALFQNAFAAITAKVRYTGRDKAKRLFEFGTTRYGIILTGEELPDGGQADAVYILLNPIYRELLNKSELRPLDYGYLKALRHPMAQRFYELLSFQIYGALESSRPRRAKYLYSEFCQQAPQQRYFQFKRMHMQMKEVHAPHQASGYIVGPAEFKETTDSEGRIDWEMLYTPGPKARAEHRAVNDRKRSRTAEEAPLLPLPEMESGPDARPIGTPHSTPPEQPSLFTQPTTDSVEPEVAALIEQLVSAELNRGDAERLAREKPDECRRQLEFLPHVKEFKTSRGAYLRRAIEEGYGPPKAYSQVQAREESAQAARRQRGHEALRLAEETARQSHEKRHSEAFARFLGEWVGQWQTTQL